MVMSAPKPTDLPLLAAALAYAERGWAVFPCHASGAKAKQPLVAKGFHAASRDPAQIRDWWEQFPSALIGVPTGATVGHWVLDIDVHAGAIGPQSLAAWEAEQGPLPATWQVRTASGGQHLLFRWPTDGREVLSRVNVAPGIDVRGRGGYVIAPPSQSDQGEWFWAAESADEVAMAPEWLLARVCAASVAVTAPPAARQGAGDAGPGQDVSFFSRVNTKALAMLGTWVPAVFPGAKPYHQGFRVSSASLMRDLQEDISLLPEGIRDFGAEQGCTPIDIVLQYGPVATPSEAALWLCQRMGIAATHLGWRPARGPAAVPALPFGAAVEFAPDPVVGEFRDEPQAPPDAKPPRHAPQLKVVAGLDFRPTITLINGDHPEAVDDAERYLIAAGVDVYQHGTRLVRVGRWEQTLEAVVRPAGSGVLIDITPGWLADALTRKIEFERFDARTQAMKRIDCPMRLAATLLERVGSWSFPGLVGFTDSPTLDLRGRLITEPGYDAPSGLFLSRPPAIAPMATMDRYLAEREGEILSEAVETFPFVSPGDLSACLAMILTALLRRILPAAPIGAVTANTPATGKSKLVDVVAAIATGRGCPVTGLGSTQEELEKRIDALLLKGDLLASFDNVDRPVKSDILCQVTTQSEKSIRVMGLSKIVDAPTNVFIMMTGNNLTLVGDLVRRCLVVHLDAGCERPELRQFTRDAVEHVLERRPELIRAALAISKGYLDAGCPDVGAAPFGSFEVWDKMVRRPLMWAGFADPLKPAEAMRDQDHELSGLREFLREWQAELSEPVSAAELSEAIRAKVPTLGGDWVPKYHGLQDAAIQIMGDLSKWGPKDLGYRLRAMTGRMFDGRRIAKSAKAKSGVRWLVEGESQPSWG